MSEKFRQPTNLLDRLLKTKFTLPNGKLTSVFVKKKDRDGHYNCLLCSSYKMNPHNVIEHSRGRRHNRNLDLVDTSYEAESPNDKDLRVTVDRCPNGNNSFQNGSTWSKITESAAKCVPPRSSLVRGEDHRTDTKHPRISKLQTVIDEIRDISIIGLEHILEIQLNDEASHLCVLCQKMFERISDVVEHLTSYNHRLLYMKTFFPKVFDDVSSLIEMACEGIENKYHRSKVTVLEKSEFLKDKEKLIRLPSTEYINDTIGCSELVLKRAGKDIAASADGNCTAIYDGIISISSDTSGEGTIPGSTTASGELNKLATFWTQMMAAKNELLKTYKLYVTHPHTYPGYYKMWVSFWNTRFPEVRDDGALKSYDWTAQWASEWRKIMDEKLKIDMEVKCSRIKKMLGITDSMLGEHEKELIQSPHKVFGAVKPSQSTPETILHDKSTTSIASKSRVKSRSPQQPIPSGSVPSPNSGQTSFRSNGMKTTAAPSNQFRKPFGLEQLLEKHNHKDDFLISWRELLDIFGIQDNRNSNETESTSTEIYHELTDLSKQQMNFVGNVAVKKELVENVEPVTVISVLRSLVPQGYMLGGLAVKVMNLLETAVAMEALKANSSNTLLNNSNYCIVFETIREKFEGLLLGEMVAANSQNIVRKLINDITNLLQTDVKSKTCCVLPAFKVERTLLQPQSSLNQNVVAAVPPQRRMSISSASPNCYLPPPSICGGKPIQERRATVLIESAKNRSVAPPFNQSVEKTAPQRRASVSFESVKNHSVSPPSNQSVGKPQASSFPTITDSNEPAALKDSEIKVLMVKFSHLSEKDKANFEAHLNTLSISDPNRITRLRNEVRGKQALSRQSSVLEWKTEMKCPGEAAYSHSTNHNENTFGSDERDKSLSMAYQVAQKHAGVTIKRKAPDEGVAFVNKKRFYEDRWN